MDGILHGKICVVTGVSGGIGNSIARHFIEEGAIVYTCARKNGSIDGLGIPNYFDIRDRNAVKELFSRIRKEQGSLDILVNNAGITKNEVIGMIREDTVEEMYSINVFAPIQMLQMAARLMKPKKNGSIINITSIVGVEGSVGELAYSGTKGAIISITKSAAKELASYRIRVNAVAPGYTDTNMFRNAINNDEDKLDDFIKNVRFGRLAQPDDIADTCVWLASEKSRFITGQIIGVNGSTII